MCHKHERGRYKSRFSDARGDICLLSGQSSNTARVLADLFAGRSDVQGEDRYRGGKWITLSTDGHAILEGALAGAEFRR